MNDRIKYYCCKDMKLTSDEYSYISSVIYSKNFKTKVYLSYLIK